jgi:prepilin-type N-terminal cleavage/methylation domain-containing protein
MPLSRKNEKGFTLIELIIVIIILGIIAGVAVPKFIGLSASARTAAARAVGGALSSSIASLHANYLVNTADYNIADVISNTTFTGGVTSADFTHAANATNGFDTTCNYQGTNFVWHYVPRTGQTTAYLDEIGTWY